MSSRPENSRPVKAQTVRSQGTAPATDGVFELVTGLLGPDRCRLEGTSVVASPTTDDEAAALLRCAHDRGWRVLPVGRRSGPGSTPTGADASDGRRPALILSSEAMRGVIEHEPGDLVARARSGTSLGELQQSVRERGQWVAIDPPGGTGVSVGGVVATGVPGPLRALYGRPRDHVLGLTLVDGSGRVLTLGGRVVKNVAGFDLVRLATGSRGTMGMITEVTVRLYPTPEEERTIVWDHDHLEGAWKVGREIGSLSLPIAAAELVVGHWGDGPPAAADGDGARVIVRLSGTSRAVDRMAGILVERMGAPTSTLPAAASQGWSDRMSAREGSEEGAFRLHLLPDRVGAVLEAIESLAVDRLAVHLLDGTVRGYPGRRFGPDETAVLAGAARAVSGRLEGSVEHDPDRSRGRALASLRARIVRGFDPAGILPGAWRDGWLRPGGVET